MIRQTPPVFAAAPMRLQKALANAGLGSRREIEGWIQAGRIQINGRPAKLGDRVGPADRVCVDGREVRLLPPDSTLRVIAYNKPEGEVVSRRDPQGRATVFAHLPPLEQGRWIAVGRLDLNTAGLLLLTTSGELAHRLMHPSRAVEREYAVRVLGEVSEAALHRLTHGVALEDGRARFEEIVESGGEGANRWYHVVLCEGRHREVRRLWEAVGLRVSRLKRVRYGGLILDSRVKSRQWRELTPQERDDLLKLAGMTGPGFRPSPSGQAAGGNRREPSRPGSVSSGKTRSRSRR